VSFVLPLRKATDPAIAGGKAAGCARLLALKQPVPDGFVVTTRAFREFMAPFEARRRELVALFRTSFEEDQISRACAHFVEELRGAAIPTDVKRDVLTAYARLGDPVAVRSSVTLEDGASGAFAGVFHTALDVRADRVLPSILDVWARSFRYAALAAVMRQNADPLRCEVAVLVQPMIKSECAGVLFTQDPSGAHPDHAIVSVAPGTGVVDGRAVAETIRIERTDPRPPDPLLGRLLATGLGLEKRFGRPLDIEWTVSHGEIRLLQARPITTIEPARGITWTRELSEERFPNPISPLGWSALEEILPVNLVTLRKRFGLVARRPDDVARTIGHYVYSSEKFFSIPGSMRVKPLRQARFAHHYVAALASIAWNAPRARGQLKTLALSRFFRAFVFPHAREVRQAWDGDLDKHLRGMDAFDAVDPRRMSLPALWKHRHAMLDAARRYMEPDLAIYVIKMACSWMVERLAPGKLADLTAGLGENRTMAMNAEFVALYDALRGPALEEERYDELLGSGTLARFVARNGHTTVNWDLMEPTWGENPRRILMMARTYAAAIIRRNPAADEQARREMRLAARERAMAALPGWLAPVFDQALRTLHDFMRIDEEHHFYCSRLFTPMRRLYAELGARLAADRIVDRASDVWFLTVPEIEEALANPFPRRYLVEQRRASFRRAQASRPPDRYVDQRPLFVDRHEPADAQLRGEAASPGVARGLVRVVESPDEAAAFRPGEILVTPSPNPAWTPMYAVAGALVTATGSVLSHGLVSAREYSLPAVIGIPDVTRRLVTGQKVRVDGHQGVVCVE